MKAVDKGSVCVKTAGRTAGEKVVVLELKDNNFAIIEGVRIKKKRCNLAHLIPTGKKIEVTKSITQKDLAKKLE